MSSLVNKRNNKTKVSVEVTSPGARGEGGQRARGGAKPGGAGRDPGPGGDGGRSHPTLGIGGRKGTWHP